MTAGSSSPLSSSGSGRSSRSREDEEKTENLRTAPDESECRLRDSNQPKFVQEEIRTLEGVSYYHGMAARDLVESRLRRRGDFLVRATDNRVMAFELILSLFNKKRIHNHLTIKCDLVKKKWYLGVLATNEFDSIALLVHFYQHNPLGSGFYLARAVSKGKHMIAHDRIKYDTKKDLLGNGNFGDVFKGLMELEECKVKVALKNTKQLDELLNPELNPNANKIKKEMISEAEVMSQLRHSNITAFFGMAADRLPVLLVIEFCCGGNLETHVKKHGKDITFMERMLYIHDASAGLKYIHSMSITHRDIAIRNCLISVNGMVKLSDFGMGLKVRKNETNIVSTPGAHCPARWMAPEIQTAKTMPFSKMSDIWSLGILIYEVFSNATKPFFDLDNKEAMAMVRSGKYPKALISVGSYMEDMLNEIHKLDPMARPSADIFHDNFHEYCIRENILNPTNLNILTLNLINGVKREQMVHWGSYVPQVVVYDMQEKELGWNDAPQDMLANVVWRGPKPK